MYLVYVGQSGVPGDPASPHPPLHVTTGLMVHEESLQSVKAQFDVICHGFFGAMLGSPGVPDSLCASDLVLGNGPFASWPLERRERMVESLVNIMTRRETPVIAAYVSSEKFTAGDAWSEPWHAAFSRVVYSLDMLMDEINVEQAPPTLNPHDAPPIEVKERAVIVAESSMAARSRTVDELVRTSLDLPTGSVADNVLYSGQFSHCHLLADLCAYFVGTGVQDTSDGGNTLTELQEAHVIQVVYPVEFF